MKLRQIIIIGGLVLILGGIFFLVTKNNQRKEQETIEKKLDTQYFEAVTVNNRPHSFSLTTYGQIMPNKELVLSPQVNGKLLAGNVSLKPGTKFRKGQLLFKIENTETLYSLNARKSSYINLIGSIMPDISLDFPSEKEKWNKYLTSIRLDKNIPVLPMWSNQKEKLLLAQKNILTEYFNIKALEENINKYYVFAPFSGTITQKFTDAGATVGLGTQIIKVVKTGDFELKIPVQSENIDLVKKGSVFELKDSDNKNIGTGKVARISDILDANTQSIDVYLNVTPKAEQRVYNGMFLNVELGTENKVEAVALPKRAIKNGQVYVFVDSTKFTTKPVNAIHYFSDSVLVKGLNNGDNVMPSTHDFYNPEAPVKMILKK